MTKELFDAIAAGAADTVSRLTLDDPSLLHARNADGVAAIVWARYAGKPDIAELLGAQALDLDLAESAALGRADRVRDLLAAGAAVDDVSPDGFTPLHYAAFFGHLPLARLLVDRGAALDPRARSDMAVTPLHSAVAGRHHEVAMLLVEAGADVNAVQHQGWTPLHAAAQYGDRALVEALLAHGADPQARAEDGTTSTELAAAGGFAEVAMLLAD